MLMPKIENPWDIKSIYDLQYFNCPSCCYKFESKQVFVCHAYDTHPDSVYYLRKNLFKMKSFLKILKKLI